MMINKATAKAPYSNSKGCHPPQRLLGMHLNPNNHPFPETIPIIKTIQATILAILAVIDFDLGQMKRIESASHYK